MLNRNKKKIQLFILLFYAVNASAQSSSSSPYSRYGIGDLQFNGFIKNIGMGGVSAGYNPAYNLNISNPASYSSLGLTTFETGVNMNQVRLKTTSKTQDINDVSLSYFAFGFPVKNKKWGAGFGLLPYSNVGYSINDLQTNASGDIELHTYDGSGGLNQFFIGNGYSPFKNFSIGVNASYLFGVVNQERRIEYPRLTNYFNTRIFKETSVGSVYFNFGMQMTFDSLRIASGESIQKLNEKQSVIQDSIVFVNGMITKSGEEQKGGWEIILSNLNRAYAKNDSIKQLANFRKEKNKWSLTLGLTGSPSASLTGKYSNLTENFVYSIFNNPIIRDTIENTVKKSGSLVLPLSLGFGMMLKQGLRWQIGSDLSVQNWKNYSIFGSEDSLGNSWRFAAGAQYHPKPAANDLLDKKISYLKNIQYRMGFHYSQTYLVVHGIQLNEYGLSIGFGLPVKRSAAMIQLAAEVGKRGTTTNNLIEENYLKLSIGFTLSDRWFIKTKID